MSLRPFVVDPSVMARIRPTEAIDISAIARLHEAAMGQSMWARIGPRFLRALYRALIDDERFLSFVYTESNDVRGFIAGSIDTEQMLKSTLARAWPTLAIAAFPKALHPKILGKLLQTTRYDDTSGGEQMPESLFCSFEPGLRGKRISGHINKVLFDELLARGHSTVKVTTETTNKGANRQLLSWGFVDAAHFRFYGKEMIRYELDLVECERVEAISRHRSVS
jgi:hypothetical protein